jgi:hypothetical protein
MGRVEMPNYPGSLNEIKAHAKRVKAALRAAGVHAKTLQSISTKALKTGRKVTGQHATNRDARWSIPLTHPQYGTELDCHVIFVKLCAQIFCFDGAPQLPDDLREILETQYLGHPIAPGSYRDKLLLERFSFDELVAEGLNPVHGHSGFHIGHEDPSLAPKHQPGNIGWRSFRSNLIQGNMTLREARIYFVKLIGRYFELGEIDVN